MKMKLLSSALLVSVLLAGAAQAESLAEAMALAYASNPVLRAERAGLRATDEQLAQARARRLPTADLSASAGYSRVKQGSPFFTDSSSFKPRNRSLSINQTLYGGGIQGGIDAARATVEAGRANLIGMEQSVLLDSAAAYLNARRDEEVVRIRKNNVAVLARQHEAAQDRFDVGEITRTDVSQAIARVAGARSQWQAALSALANSRATYERVIGRPPGSLEIAEVPHGVPEGVRHAQQIAEAESPAILEARHKEVAARRQVNVARSSLRPTVSLGLSAGKTESGGLPRQRQDSYNATARITMPLFTGGLNQSQTREAKQRASQARLLLVQTRRQVVEQVAQAWSTLIAARAVIASSQEQVNANELAFEGVEEEAQVGLRTTLDVLDAEQELLNARLTLVSAERDATFAAFSLLATMGQLTASKLGLDVALYDPASYGKRTGRGLFGTGIDE